MNLPAEAVRLLQAWRPPAHDPYQEELRRDYLALLVADPEAVWRHRAPAHLTASALVVDLDGRRVLLALHAKAGLWLQTGGHCEPADATLAAAALREAREESGIDGLRLGAGPVRLDRHSAPCAPGVVEHHLDVQFLAFAPPGTEPVRSAESTAVDWFAPESLPEPTDDAVRALVATAFVPIAQSQPSPARVAAENPSRKPRARSVRG